MRRKNTMSSDVTKSDTQDITEILKISQENIVNDFMKEFDSRIAGQDEAKRAIINTLLTGIFALKREGALWAIFLGWPTWVGKSELVKTLALILFWDSDAYTPVEGETLKHPADVAVLNGAPPGYVGYGDTPRLGDKRLYKGYNSAIEWNTLHPFLRNIYGLQGLSIVLIDETEKAHIEVMTAFLWAITNGKIEMNSPGWNGGHSKVTNLHNTLFIFTSNIWEDDIANENRSNMGFTHNSNQRAWDDATFQNKLKKHFPPEFLGRMNHIVRCHPMNEAMAIQIMNIYLARINTALSPYFEGKLLAEITPRYQKMVLDINKDEIKEKWWRPIVRHMNTVSEKVWFSIHQGPEILGEWFGWGTMVFDVNTQWLPTISLTRADTKMKLLQILPEWRRRDIAWQTIDTVLGGNRKMIETYMRLITQYDTAFYDAVRDLEKRLIEKIGFTEDQIKEIRMTQFLNFHDNIIGPSSAYEQITEDDGLFGGLTIRAIKSIIAWLVKQKVAPWVIYEWVYNFVARPLTPQELQFVWYYMLQQEMLRHAKIRD